MAGFPFPDKRPIKDNQGWNMILVWTLLKTSEKVFWLREENWLFSSPVVKILVDYDPSDKQAAWKPLWGAHVKPHH